jgi:hypothetical protein
MKGPSAQRSGVKICEKISKDEKSCFQTTNFISLNSENLGKKNSQKKKEKKKSKEGKEHKPRDRKLIQF